MAFLAPKPTASETSVLYKDQYIYTVGSSTVAMRLNRQEVRDCHAQREEQEARIRLRSTEPGEPGEPGSLSPLPFSVVGFFPGRALTCG